MNWQFTSSARAEADVRYILRWLHARSPRGAAAWYEAFNSALDQLRQGASGFGLAPEAKRLKREIRQILFKTRRGKRYRIVYVIIGDEVNVLRVRGPGQRPLRKRDLPTED